MTFPHAFLCMERANSYRRGTLETWSWSHRTHCVLYPYPKSKTSGTKMTTDTRYEAWQWT